MGAQCKAAFIPVNIPNLKQKNQYILMYPQPQIDQRQFTEFSRKIFGMNKQLIQTHKSLLLHLYGMKREQKFIDPHFIVKGKHLSKTQDYVKKSILLYNKQNKPGLQIFQQKDLEFSYLSVVLFFLCQNKQFLKKRILLNEQINDRQIYGFRLFCNGQESNVIVDDVVPVWGDNFIYTTFHGKEIWPSLLEKAWCKQIGSYDKARGLSPEQCFQQITGIPAFSIRIEDISQQKIYYEFCQYKRLGCWLSVVAFKNVDYLKPGQVFLIDEVQDQNICLTSPYVQFSYPKDVKESSRSGHLKLNFHTFRNSFEYLIVGWPKMGYVPISKKLYCQKRQQKLFQIYLHKKQQVSIRFTQFFDGYLNDSQKSNYEYSPLATFQLYDKRGDLLYFCQGCDKIYSGAHSVYFTKNIFHELENDVYYLRVEVDWENYGRLKQGNIVIYASQNNVQIQELQSSDLKQKIKKLHHVTLHTPKSVIPNNQQGLYQLRFVQKKTNVIISILNKTESHLRLQLDFAKSLNFRVKYQKLLPKDKVIVNLAPLEIKYIQILPQQIRKQFKLQPFTVKKLPLTQK